MAFFTRHNTTVPILPAEDCRSEYSTLTQDKSALSENSMSASEKPVNRYEYVVDRELGVEV